MMKRTLLLSITYLFVTYIVAQNVSGIAQSAVVMLANGTEVSIEEVRVDDLLLTLNEDGSIIAVSRVLDTTVSEVENLKKVTLANGSEILITPNHPILGDKGWVSANNSATKLISNYENAKVSNYNVDTFIYTLNTDLKIDILPIIEVEDVTNIVKVYKLTLDSRSAFIVNGVFVGQ